jgi:hypothetical protein
MVFSAAFLAATAKLCQRPSRTGRRRLRADEVLRALFVPPARLVDFFCLPLPESYVPGSAGRGGVWVARAPSTALYRYRRSLSFSSSSSSEGEFYYLED